MEIRRTLSTSKLASKMDINKNTAQTNRSRYDNNNNPLDRYQICEMVGQGQFGKVYKGYIRQGINKNNGKQCNMGKNNGSRVKDQKVSNLIAIKTIPLSKLDSTPSLPTLLTNEVHILSSLQHENIIKFHTLFHTQSKIYMIYQYCQGGSLEDQIPIPQHKALKLVKQIVSGFAYAEERGILHRDVKPANVLFKAGVAKIADWGFCRWVGGGLAARSFVGSPAYMAPQVLKGLEYTGKADVWSFGVMIYECLFNRMPWKASSIKQLLSKIQNTTLQIPRQTDPILRQILRLCLQTNPQKRTSFKKLFKLLIEKTQRRQNPQQQSDKKPKNPYKLQQTISHRQMLPSKTTERSQQKSPSPTHSHSRSKQKSLSKIVSKTMTKTKTKSMYKYKYQRSSENQRSIKKQRSRQICRQRQREGDQYFDFSRRESQVDYVEDSMEELSHDDIRKCSQYLEFAKAVQKFQDFQVKVLTLQLILNFLNSIKLKYTNVRYSQMTPSHSLRKLPQKHLKAPYPFSPPTQTQSLLNKQITLIQKILKCQNPDSHSQISKPPKATHTIIKQLLKKLLKNINISQKYYNTASTSPSTSKLQHNNSSLSMPTRKELEEMNYVLEIVMYGVGGRSGDGLSKEVGKMGLVELMRMVNCRILYVNRKYCNRQA